jgi:signal transduction histidine kinase
MILFCQISSFINFLTSLIVGVVSLNRNVKGTLNRAFSYFAFSVSFWSFFYFLWQFAGDVQLAYIWCKILMSGAIFIPAAFFHFCLTLIKKEKDYRNILFGAYFTALVFLFFNIFSSAIIGEIKSRFGFPFWPAAGFLYIPFLFYFFFLAGWAHFLMFKAFRSLSGHQRNQIKYVSIGTLIGFLGGGTNYPFWFDINIPPVGNILVSVYVGMTAYAIIKYHLMDIRLAISNAAIFIFVYALVLGIPFYYYSSGFHFLALLMMLVLASAGPMFYDRIQRRAEAQILSEQKTYQKNITESIKNILNLHEINEICSFVVTTIQKTMRLSYAAFFLLKQPDSFLKLASFSGTVPEKYPGSFQVDGPTVSFLNNQSGPVFKEELLSQIPASDRVFASLDAELFIPVKHEKKFLGFLVLGRKQNNTAFSEQDTSILDILCRQAGLAIDFAYVLVDREQGLQNQAQKQRFQMMGEMAVGMSHQMNNRFHAIINRPAVFCKMYTDYKQGEQRFPVDEILEKAFVCIKSVEDVARGGSEIIEKIMCFSKADFTESVVHFDPVFKMTVDVVNLKHSKFKYQLNTAYPEDVVLKASPATVQDILFNALDNSIMAMELKKNTPEKDNMFSPTINVCGKIDGNFFNLAIEDNGLGIRKEHLNKVTDPMFTTKGHNQGTGMGTTIMLKFIQQLGGTLKFESEYGKFCRVLVSLPISEQKGA